MHNTLKTKLLIDSVCKVSKFELNELLTLYPREENHLKIFQVIFVSAHFFTMICNISRMCSTLTVCQGKMKPQWL